MDYLGFTLWAIGFIIEVVADRQHSVWKKQHKDQFIQSGLWNYSRRKLSI
jgi:steroid 5-alpha reductase family enzyme